MGATEFQKWINIKWTWFYYMLILQYEKKIQELATKNHEKSRNIFLWAMTAATTFLIILLLSNCQQNKFHFPFYITKFLTSLMFLPLTLFSFDSNTKKSLPPLKIFYPMSPSVNYTLFTSLLLMFLLFQQVALTITSLSSLRTSIICTWHFGFCLHYVEIALWNPTTILFAKPNGFVFSFSTTSLSYFKTSEVLFWNSQLNNIMNNTSHQWNKMI